MNNSNLFVMTLVITSIFLIIQRTERRKWWLGILVLLPVGYLIYRWAVDENQQTLTLTALAIAAAINVTFWLVYGRRHPPGSSDSIKVIGMDD